ncbi:hypothetical protein PsYK624_074690 [Phanerochaete sordida]|uniref:Uncharacterized protein n=1 Tax=Phanerochaete sordida TaxID=48140 RepID=A0A9P3GCF6_9APHY|nr:hypothetical protein PsYK624_074690 [Phanerochaete sordida]
MLFLEHLHPCCVAHRPRRHHHSLAEPARRRHQRRCPSSSHRLGIEASLLLVSLALHYSDQQMRMLGKRRTSCSAMLPKPSLACMPTAAFESINWKR